MAQMRGWLIPFSQPRKFCLLKVLHYLRFPKMIAWFGEGNTRVFIVFVVVIVFCYSLLFYTHLIVNYINRFGCLHVFLKFRLWCENLSVLTCRLSRVYMARESRMILNAFVTTSYWGCEPRLSFLCIRERRVGSAVYQPHTQRSNELSWVYLMAVWHTPWLSVQK